MACKSEGSDQLDVRWFKDGYLVKPEYSLRAMYIRRLPPDLLGHYTSYLEIKKATASDRGEYECRVSDWNQEVSASVFLEVITPPIVDLLPANPSVNAATVTVNNSFVLTCRDEHDLARRTESGLYTWLKNGKPLDRLSCNESNETYEDLFPVGSLLKVTSIQVRSQFPKIILTHLNSLGY